MYTTTFTTNHGKVGHAFAPQVVNVQRLRRSFSKQEMYGGHISELQILNNNLKNPVNTINCNSGEGDSVRMLN